MKVLIIGGTGVLSGAVTREALNRGINVTMINRGNRKIPDQVTFIKSDNKKYSFIKSQISNFFFDAVIDFLCYSENDLRESFSLYKNYTNQYFFISSGAVYNTSLGGGPFNEDSPKVLPIWDYSIKKWNSEKELIELAEKSPTNYTIIRPGVTYDDSRIPYGIMPPYGYHWTLCARILAHKPIIIWKEGKIRSSVMRVEDFASAMVSLIGNENAYNQAFNISGDESPSASEVLDIVGKYLGEDVITFDIPSEFYAKEYSSRYGEILGGRSIDSPLDNTKLKRTVPSYKQNIYLIQGIKKTIEAYKQQNYQYGIDWRFDAETDRIIKKWCKKNKIDYNQYNLGFTDYLGEATNTDKLDYWLVNNKENLCVLFGIKALNLYRKILRKLKS